MKTDDAQKKGKCRILIGLKEIYPGVELSSGTTFGGNQRNLKNRTLQRCGCGVVAALDLVRYIHLYRDSCHTTFFTGIDDVLFLPLAVYDLCAMRMQRNFIPAVYPVGTTVFSLTAGLNRYFRRYHIPLQASWGVSKVSLWVEMERMLSQNLPVILAIGHQFSGLRAEDGLQLYRYQGERMAKATYARAHYVTVVAISEKWLKISSWGQVYYISREKFLRYRERASLPVLCNIVRLQEVKCSE